MEAKVYETPLFKDIFQDYESFAEWYKQTGLSDDDTDVPSKKTFTLIFNEYADCHSAFAPFDFKCHFANDLYTYYREFEETTKSLLELMKLTDDEIANADTMIINNANIPETESSTDEETVDFISQQQKTINKKGKLQIKREQLSNKRAFTTNRFLNRFKHLFIKILSSAYTPVYVEDNDD